MAAKGPSMMEQYRAVKARNPDCLLFFRLGDFYELFDEDAREASRLLGLTLTARASGEGRTVRTPMAGVPYHAASQYLRRLLQAGKRVAICEQMEDPRTAKGVVRRELVRVLTPGTALEDGFADERANNYAAAFLAVKGAGAALAWADNGTGAFGVQRFDPGEPAQALEDALRRVRPAEVILPAGRPAESGFDPALASCGAVLAEEDAATFAPAEGARLLRRHFGVASLAGLGLSEDGPDAGAAGALLAYLGRTQRSALEHVASVEVFRAEGHLILDASAQRDLELVANLEDGGTAGTLFGILDHTATAAGARTLKRWITAPLGDVRAIAARQDAVEALAGDGALRSALAGVLGRSSDLGRVVSKAACAAAGPRDLAGARQTLRLLPELGALLAGKAALPAPPDPAPLEGLGRLLEAALVEEPPALAREGGFIRPGHDPELDEALADGRGARERVLAAQERERGRTGNPKLKVQFNGIFGFYIEIPKGQAHSAPADYERKQTLVHAERYTTPELRDIESRVLTAETRAKAREAALFEGLRAALLKEARPLPQAAAALAELDALVSLAEAAARGGWARPVVDDSEVLDIAEGRHPVVERLLAAEGGSFTPNDCRLDAAGAQIQVITGPNMAGKSTYMRQAALITVLAQAGSFVPARSARVGRVDRVFTRVGASDRLSRGMSTFLVEMTELSAILRGALRRSLVVLDEIGRGTGTYDGISIAWAAVEHLHDRIGCRTLFATHYFELTELARRLERVRNHCVAVRQWQGAVVFLHAVREGASEHSYGIDVARLAGVPDAVLARARAVLASLEMNRRPPEAPAEGSPQPDLFLPADPGAEAAAQRLRALDPERMTPLEALQELSELKRLAGG